MGKPAPASSTRARREIRPWRDPPTKLRPWLQDFNLGAPGAPGTVYTADMVRQEKQAVYDTADTTTSSEYYGGWMLWNAANVYTAAALDPK